MRFSTAGELKLYHGSYVDEEVRNKLKKNSSFVELKID